MTRATTILSLAIQPRIKTQTLPIPLTPKFKPTPQVQLVLEYCDRGTLRALLNTDGSVTRPDGGRDMLAIVSIALDIAKAMLHLHSVNVVGGAALESACHACMHGAGWLLGSRGMRAVLALLQIVCIS